MDNDKIRKNGVEIFVVFGGHDNPEDDYIQIGYEVEGIDIPVFLDKKQKEMLATAPFVGSGSNVFPVCPFCGEKVRCKKHYLNLDRADLFESAIFDINEEDMTFLTNNNMFKEFGIVTSGNLMYSENPEITVQRALDYLYNKSKKKSDIKNLYTRLKNGEHFKYVFKSGDSWTV